jgi:hypothetical protein
VKLDRAATFFIFVLFPLTLWAVPYSPEHSASNMARLLNEAKNLEGLLAAISMATSLDESKDFAQLLRDLTDQPLNLMAPLPVATAKGDKISLAGSRLKVKFNKDRSFEISGRTYKPSNDPVHSVLKKVLMRKHAGLPALWIMEASANPIAEVLLGGLVDLALEACLGRAAFIVVGGTAAGIAIVWLGSQAYQVIHWGDGKVTCDRQGHFVWRKRSYGFFSAEQRLGNEADIRNTGVISPDAVKVILGKTTDQSCTASSAAELQLAIKPETKRSNRNQPARREQSNQ